MRRYSLFSLWLGKTAHSKDDWIMGIDGGGTKTHGIVTLVDGTFIGESVGNATNLAAVTEDAAVKAMESVVIDLLDQISSRNIGGRCQGVCVGMAGLDTPEDEKHSRELFFATLAKTQTSHLEFVNDALIALDNGTTAKDAIVLIAGTGSNCVGRNSSGALAKSGGMDYLLSDEGSGYWIGRKVLRIAVRSADGRDEASLLEQLVCEHFKIHDVHELKTLVYHPPLSKMKIAELAKVWEVALDRKDGAATALLGRVIDELFAHVSAVVHELNLADSPLDIVFAGSIARLPFVKVPLEEKIKNSLQQANIVIADKPPVWGAIRRVQNHLTSF